MNKAQLTTVASLLYNARRRLELSARDVARVAGVVDSNILRIERGQIANPRPDTLVAIAGALQISKADILTAAGYNVRELPSFTPYLRSRYERLPEAAQREIEQSFRQIADRYGFDPDGPTPGADEH